MTKPKSPSPVEKIVSKFKDKFFNGAENYYTEDYEEFIREVFNLGKEEGKRDERRKINDWIAKNQYFYEKNSNKDGLTYIDVNEWIDFFNSLEGMVSSLNQS